MHSNYGPVQDVMSMCTTAIRGCSNWLCHPSVCLLQARRHALPRTTVAASYDSQLAALQIQGALCLSILACGWIWAGMQRQQEFHRLRALSVPDLSHPANKHIRSHTRSAAAAQVCLQLLHWCKELTMRRMVEIPDNCLFISAFAV